MDKEIKYNRSDKREILKLNAKFDELAGAFLQKRAIHGYTPIVEDYISLCDRAWRVYAHKHNKNPKNKIKAAPAALRNHLHEIDNNEKKLQETRAKIKEKADFDRWVTKVTMRYPRLMWRWNLIGKLKKDYVKSKYKEFQGESPKQTWA